MTRWLVLLRRTDEQSVKGEAFDKGCRDNHGSLDATGYLRLSSHAFVSRGSQSANTEGSTNDHEAHTKSCRKIDQSRAAAGSFLSAGNVSTEQREQNSGKHAGRSGREKRAKRHGVKLLANVNPASEGRTG